MLDLNPLLTVFPLLLSFNFCVSTPLITPQVWTIVQLWTWEFLYLSADWRRGGRGQCSGGQHWEWVRTILRQYPMPGIRRPCFFPASTSTCHIHLWTGLSPCVLNIACFQHQRWNKNLFQSLYEECDHCLLWVFPLDFRNKWPTTVGEGMLRCYIYNWSGFYWKEYKEINEVGRYLSIFNYFHIQWMTTTNFNQDNFF